MALFETLMQVDSDLLDWLIHASPISDEQRAQMRQVFALRTELDQQLNRLVASRLKIAVTALPEDIARVDSAAAAMKSVERTIERVQTVLDIAGTVVSVAAKLLSVAVAA